MRSALISLFLLGCHPHILGDIEFAGIDDFSSDFMMLLAHLSVLMFAEDNVSQKDVYSWKYSSNRRNIATTHQNRVMSCEVGIGIWA